MADIKWIKLTTDMFNNQKIKYLRSLPEGNNIVLIWVMLLTMAGRCNAGGMIFLTENIPYNAQILANEMGFETNVVKIALQTLSSMGMIVCDETEFRIKNWEEYQNIEGMEKIRKQTRERVAKHREQKRLNDGCNVTVTDDVTPSNATDKDIDIERDIDISKRVINKERSADRTTRTFTPPTVEEVKAYCEERNNGIDAQHFVDYYQARGWILNNRKKMVDWKASVRTWEVRNKEEKPRGEPKPPEKSFKELAKEAGWDVDD